MVWTMASKKERNEMETYFIQYKNGNCPTFFFNDRQLEHIERGTICGCSLKDNWPGKNIFTEKENNSDYNKANYTGWWKDNLSYPLITNYYYIKPYWSQFGRSKFSSGVPLITQTSKYSNNSKRMCSMLWLMLRLVKEFNHIPRQLIYQTN